MPESFATRRMRWGWNFFPAYRGTGARVTYVASDFREVRVKLPLSWRTRNYVGTIFGGSLYAAVDPIYMLMLIKILGPGYTVWDKAATIHFKKPGRGTLYARLVLEEEEIQTIKRELEKVPSVDRVYRVELTDADGVVHATVEKTIYVRRKGDPSPLRPLASRVATYGRGRNRSSARGDPSRTPAPGGRG